MLFGPPPPFLHVIRNRYVLYRRLDPPPPPRCVRNEWKAPKDMLRIIENHITPNEILAGGGGGGLIPLSTIFVLRPPPPPPPPQRMKAYLK